MTQALYRAVSAPAGQRDWDAVRHHCHSEARLVRTGLNPDGTRFARVMSLDAYIENVEALLKDVRFSEVEIAHEAVVFGNVARVTSLYEFTWQSPTENRLGRGANFFTLIHEGGRWRIMSIVWDTERPGVMLPETPAALSRPPIPPPPHRGGCLCGAVRYSYDAAPLATVACHCRDCQKLTGATNLLTIYADRAAFRVEKGELARYRKRADSGREADYVRCADCGTRLWHEPFNAPQWIFIAAGTLDDPSWVVPAAHIWTSRAAPSALIPVGVYACTEGPADRGKLIAAFNATYGIG